MVRETIPSELLTIGLPVAINVLKYCAKYGVEKGFTPIAPITITINGNIVSYQDSKNMIVDKDMKITLIQFE